MDIKRMKHAIALAEELSFARAAERLHLSQPALSRSIQTLENEVGMPLFDRDNRNVALTTVGAVFMEQARRLVYQMRSLERDMGLIRNSEIGPLAFGAGPLPTAAFLPALLRQMGQERPALRLTISSNNWRYLQQHLQDEEIEFFIADTRDIQPTETITVTPLCRQYSPFICRAGHPLLARADRKPSDMLAYGFAALKLPLAIQATFRQVLGLAPHEPLPIVVECDNVGLLAARARDSDVLLMATEASVAEDLDAGRLAALHFPGLPLFYTEIGVVQLYGRSLSPAAVLVLDTLRGIAASARLTRVFADGRHPPPPEPATMR